MAESQICSQAFYAAELRSERVRIFGVLGFLGVVAVVLTVRVFLLHTTVLNSHVGWNLTLAAAVGLYEYVMLRMAVDCTLEMRQLGWAHFAGKGLQSEAEAILSAVSADGCRAHAK
jgi:hypothetical protein